MVIYQILKNIMSTIFFTKINIYLCGSYMQRKTTGIQSSKETIDHFTVVCSVTWPLNGSEAGGELVLIQTSPLLLCI